MATAMPNTIAPNSCGQIPHGRIAAAVIAITTKKIAVGATSPCQTPAQARMTQPRAPSSTQIATM